MALAAAACQPGAPPEAAPEVDVGAWRAAPDLLAVDRSEAGWRVRGRAAPEARVALRNGGQTFATSTDAEGSFVLVVPHAATARALTVETLNGQEAARAVPTLLLPPDALDAPAVLAAPGGRSTVFAPRALVEAVDSDGSVWLLSGAAPAGQAVRLVSADGVERSVTADGAGRWQAQVAPTGVLSVQDGERARVVRPAFADAAQDAPVAVAAAGEGVAFVWRLPDGAAQRLWIPNA